MVLFSHAMIINLQFLKFTNIKQIHVFEKKFGTIKISYKKIFDPKNQKHILH